MSKQEGKYVDLPGAKEGEVVVRFPPEASGYLHIGHAKAALLNQYYQLAFKGKLVFRFDDTNPEKEKEDYEHVIREDLEMLRIKPDVCSYTSDYFDLYLEKCEQLIKEGKAYVDDTPGEVMKQEREQRKNSTNRDNSVEKNLQMWNEMLTGTDAGQACCVRAKIDMQSDNGCLRDPALYRCKKQAHPRTGNKYNVYPTYDFACPIIDSIEGITHALRTTEYVDRDVQYYWILDALAMRKPIVVSYSRLNMLNTVLSKRKLTWFVDSKIVESWEDPRMPTVRGVLRRGMTVDGLKQFIISQGSSRAAVIMEWDKIWSINRKVIDPIAPRYPAVDSDHVQVVVTDAVDGETIDVNVHPKNTELGKRKVAVGTKLFIDRTDAESIKEGDVVTFVNWGNLLILKVSPTEIQAKLNLENKDFKKTFKCTWVASSVAKLTKFVYYDHLIAKPLLGKDDDFKNYVNLKSKFEIEMYIDNEFYGLQKGSIVQVLRKGFFICDKAASGTSPPTFISIPDGTTDLSIFSPRVRSWKEQNLGLGALYANEAKNATSNGSSASAESNEAKELSAQIGKVGSVITELKAAKKSKEELQPHIDKLLSLKAKYKELTGTDWVNPNAPPPRSKQAQPAKTDSSKKEPQAKKDKAESKKEKSDGKKDKGEGKKDKSDGKKKADKGAAKEQNSQPTGDNQASKKQTRLGLEVTKAENFSDWYTEVITKAELIEYYDVSGCYILRPWSYSIWEAIQQFFDTKIKSVGVSNCYFPMFVSAAALEKEKEHIADFAPEVAWVTKSGQSDMKEPIAIRPTSETVMYPTFAKWVQSHRDLPIRINQWCNVVRWEFKNPTPFLRTREFLWQEGHSAWANKDDAVAEVYQMLDFYAQVYEDLLAIPVIKGRKTEKEKFPGGEFTTTVEGFVASNGRGIQAATSHHLGTNFSKMFKIEFEDPENPGKEKQLAFQNSYGLSTRSIGTMVMTHSDDKGLVLPPRVACIQVIVTPCGITANTGESDKAHLLDECKKLEDELSASGIKCKSDLRDHVSPGWKYNHWELKGVPIRIELGPKDLEKASLVAVRRDDGAKIIVARKEAVVKVKELLETIQSCLYSKAKKSMDESIVQSSEWQAFVDALDAKKMLLSPFCGKPDCEDAIKESTRRDVADGSSVTLMGAKSLCIPLVQPRNIESSDKCIYPKCNDKPQFFTLFGRSY